MFVLLSLVMLMALWTMGPAVADESEGESREGRRRVKLYQLNDSGQVCVFVYVCVLLPCVLL